MFKNYIKTALRNISRQKGYVFINILGLAIGIASSMLIAVYIFSELSYDQHHHKKDRIYRVYLDGKINNQEMLGAWTPSPMAFTVKDKFPEVEEAVRINAWDETIIRYEDRTFVEDAFIAADSTFFKVFTAPLIKGNPRTALTKPHTVVITESTARKIFGNQPAMGKSIKVGSHETYHEVTGIMKDMPRTSHFDCNMVGSFVTSDRSSQGNWLSNNLATYLLLARNTSANQVEDKFPDLLRENAGPILEEFLGLSFDEFLEKGNRYAYHLQPLTDIHLNPEIEGGMKPAHDKKYIYIFSVVALMLIVIAAINYMNLSTARASNRAKEVGLRKVAGSTKRMLVGQFLTESVIMAFMALILAVIIVQVLLPYFNNLINTSLTLNYIDQWYYIPVLLALALLIGLLAGSYPAFYLAAFRPTSVLSGDVKSGARNKRIRSTLVVSQFVISAALILGTIVISRQTTYMLNKDLGFDKDNLLVIRRISVLEDQIGTFKAEVNKIPGVVNSTHSTMVPGHPNNNNAYQLESQPRDETYVFDTNWADEDFLDVYGIEMVSGRFFTEDLSKDLHICIVNQKSLKDYPIEDPYSERILRPGGNEEEGMQLESFQIAGVLKDFHIRSLHRPIGPYLILPASEDQQWGYLSVKVSPEGMSQTVERIEQTWKKFTDNDPMLYFFMDNEYASLYQEEQRSSSLAVAFAVLTIFIASLGLFGLTSYTAEQRTREIGIRKAMGSSVSGIVQMIGKETLRLILLALVISWPLAYYFLVNWLTNYPYRVSLQPWDFIATLLIIVVVAFITISYQTIRAARKNPAHSLRYE
ncbi:MAG: ABC transporter permease [Bacteroidales bacterium]|nr:ABC transporter permease [Bacteroidales bacterium]